MKDLYEILEVNKDALPEEIKKAYRRLSKMHHPDKGGDPEKFKEINKAYAILSDPERRKYYDETGDTGESQRNESEFLGYFVQVMTVAIEVNPPDIMGFCKSKFDEMIENGKKEIKKHTNKKENLERFKARIKKKPHFDVAGSIIDEQIKMCTNLLRKTEHALEKIREAREYLQKYRFSKREDMTLNSRLFYGLVLSGLGV
jgi:DnaJ-class molecular chaperone